MIQDLLTINKSNIESNDTTIIFIMLKTLTPLTLMSVAVDCLLVYKRLCSCRSVSA